MHSPGACCHSAGCMEPQHLAPRVSATLFSGHICTVHTDARRLPPVSVQVFSSAQQSSGTICGEPHVRFRKGSTWLIITQQGLVYIAPFPAFRYVHLQHHKHTNDPELDPDMWSGAVALMEHHARQTTHLTDTVQALDPSFCCRCAGHRRSSTITRHTFRIFFSATRKEASRG